MNAIAELGPEIGTRKACAVVGMPRATFYARSSPREPVEPAPRLSPRALTPAEQQAVLDLLHEERFVDMAPAAVVAKLLEEGTYHA